MIYVNNNFVDLLKARRYEGSDPLMLFIKEKINTIENWPGDHVVFKYRKGVIKRNKLQGIKEGKKAMIRMANNLNSPRGTELWVCTSNVAKDKVTGYVRPKPKHLSFRGSWVLNKASELDKILYLLIAASPTKGRNPMIIREDIESEAKVEFEAGMEGFRVKEALANLAGNDLHQFALACTISNPSAMADVVLRTSIFNKIEFDVKKGLSTYAKYLDMAKNSTNSKILALVQEGLDRRIITYSDTHRGFWWLAAHEQLDEELLPVPPAYMEQKENLLATFLKQNNISYTRLVKTLKAVKDGDSIMAKDDKPIEKKSKIDQPKEAKVASTVDDNEIFNTPDGKMTISDMGVYVEENDALPFSIDDAVLNKVAKVLGIKLAALHRTRMDVYSDIRKYFGLE